MVCACVWVAVGVSSGRRLPKLEVLWEGLRTWNLPALCWPVLVPVMLLALVLVLVLVQIHVPHLQVPNTVHRQAGIWWL